MPDIGVFRVGLTGGIASGKSEAARIFAELDVPVVDTDVIAREVVEPGSEGLADLVDAFGDGILNADGTLNRGILREMAFNVPAARKTLESILHPLIREETVRQARAAGGPYQLIVVPLLTESPLRLFVDRVLVVDCSEETQLARLAERDGDAGSEEQGRKILAAQASRDERLACADDVIVNEGSLDELRAEVEKLHDRYLVLARQHGRGF